MGSIRPLGPTPDLQNLERENHMNTPARAATTVRVALGATMALGGLAALATSPANAQARVIAGTLTCKGEATVGLIVGSSQALRCTYVPAKPGEPHHYSGTINKIGLDIGFKSESIIVWSVLGSRDSFAPTQLAGSYVGASAEASVALGVGANALVGGNKNAVVLQPLSIQGQTGLNVAVGITGLTLN